MALIADAIPRSTDGCRSAALDEKCEPASVSGFVL